MSDITKLQNGGDVADMDSEETGAPSKIRLEDENKLSGISFCPPLYRQRYSLVADILRQEQVCSVVDFGSAECKMMSYMKRVNSLQLIIGVDIDGPLLEMNKFLLRPLTAEYLLLRPTPLKMQLYQGSVAVFDDRLKGVEAVVMVEIIEHLEPKPLTDFPEVVFHKIKPRLVVITTPNSDFNILFPNFTGKRHWDHKFEWSQNEFIKWCEDICHRYDYTVTYDGVGEPPEDKSELGYCSQVAIFKCSVDWNANNESSTECEQQQDYKLVCEQIHPYKPVLSHEEQILREANYYICLLATEKYNDDQSREDSDSDDINISNGFSDQGQAECDSLNKCAENNDVLIPVSLQSLMKFHKMKNSCGDIDELRKSLADAGYKMTSDGMSVIYTMELPEDSDDDSDCCSTDEADVADCGSDGWETEEDWEFEQKPIVCQNIQESDDVLDSIHVYLCDACRAERIDGVYSDAVVEEVDENDTAANDGTCDKRFCGNCGRPLKDIASIEVPMVTRHRKLNQSWSDPGQVGHHPVYSDNEASEVECSVEESSSVVSGQFSDADDDHSLSENLSICCLNNTKE